MATLIELCKQNQLFQLDPQLGLSVTEERFVYLIPDVKQWFVNVLPATGSTWDITTSPIEQVDALMATFCSGDPLAVGRAFKHLVFRDAFGIWELKTADVRLFGWFPQKDHFIASGCGLTQIIKEVKLYHGYSTKAQRDRKLLDLDEPKFIPGGNPDDVVSNYYFP